MSGDDWMTTARFPAEVLQRAGLSPASTQDWAASVPGPEPSLRAAANAVSEFLTRGEALVGRLPARTARTDAEQAARDAITAIMNDARENFLRSHAAGLYDELTGRCTRSPARIQNRSRRLSVVITPSRSSPVTAVFMRS